MADSSSLTELPQDSVDDVLELNKDSSLSSLAELPRGSVDDVDDVLELNKDLERIIEAVENISVQLTWMGYDMVALRTSPELGTSMQKLKEAYHKCHAIICGDRDQEPEMSTLTSTQT